MPESKVKNENFITILGWMINELDLKGNELLIYAIIYGFSQSGAGSFNGGLQYLADWTNSSKESIRKCLASLIAKNYIVKTEKYLNNIKYCEYTIQQSCIPCNKVGGSMQQSCMEYTTKLYGGMQQSCTNNINNNIEEKIKNNKQSSAAQTIESEFETCWSLYPKKEGKKTALAAFKRARKSGVTVEQIKQGIINYVDHIKSARIENRFIKQGSTYFNGECWNDDYSVNTSAAQTQTETKLEVGITDDFFK